MALDQDTAGCAIRVPRADPLFAWIRNDHFVVEPPNPEYRCSPVSVASHTLYENGSPYEPTRHTRSRGGPCTAST